MRRMIVTAAGMQELPLARVEFDFTVDDLVDVQMRSASVRQAVLAARCRAIKAFGLLAAAGSAAGIAVPPLRTDRVLWTLVVVLVVAALLQLLPWRGRVARTLQRSAVRRMPSGTARCVVELRSDRLDVRQFDAISGTEWSRVSSVDDSGADVVVQGPFLVVVRGRAFARPEDRAAFVAIARERMTAARVQA
jgi:hypothetical protein